MHILPVWRQESLARKSVQWLQGRKERQRVAASYVVASEKGCILRVKMVEFADGLDVEGERNRGDKDESWGPGLRNGVNYGIIF